MRVLVMIPAYNEQDSILTVIKNLHDAQPGYDYIVINDCSTDRTRQLLDESNARYISLPINLGIGGGVQTGYKYALQEGYDIAVQMDGDGQHDPAFLQTIVRPVMEGECDMCVGSRFLADGEFQTTFMRRFGINLLSFLIRIFGGVHIRDVTSGFRACNADLIRLYSSQYAQDYPEPEAIMTALVEGYTVKEAGVHMHERMGGVSSIKPMHSAYYMIKVSLAVILCRLVSDRKKRKQNKQAKRGEG